MGIKRGTKVPAHGGHFPVTVTLGLLPAKSVSQFPWCWPLEQRPRVLPPLQTQLSGQSPPREMCTGPGQSAGQRVQGSPGLAKGHSALAFPASVMGIFVLEPDSGPASRGHGSHPASNPTTLALLGLCQEHRDFRVRISWFASHVSTYKLCGFGQLLNLSGAPVHLL